jgi:hypothetical protein
VHAAVVAAPGQPVWGNAAPDDTRDGYPSDLEPSRIYVHSPATFSKDICGRYFKVIGSYFAQQSSFTSCAHAASMVVIRNIYQAGNRRKPSLTYLDMNEMLSIDQMSRNASCGLETDEIARILAEKGGLKVSVITSEDASPFDVIASSYQACEAGLPAIITFIGEPHNHAMAVIGHTFQPGMWYGALTNTYFNNAQYPYHPSHTWVDGLVVQDDNFGPYSILPWKSLIDRKPTLIMPRFSWASERPSEEPQNRVHELLTRQIIYVAEDVFGLGKNKKCRTLLEDILIRFHFDKSDEEMSKAVDNFWFNELRINIRDRCHVLRTVPCTSDRYLRFLTLNTCLQTYSNIMLDIRKTLDQGPFWLVEVSIPELYQWNGRRLGEVIIRDDPQDPSAFNVILVRLPGILTLFLPPPDPAASTLYLTEHHAIGGAYHYPIEKSSNSPLSELQVFPD